VSTLVGTQGSKGVWETPPVKPLNEAIWQAWLAKGAARDRRSSNGYALAAKCVLMVVLLFTAALWSRLTPYEVVVRFIVAAGAMLLVAQAAKAKSYAFAAVFAALAVLYNPVAPVLSFAGDWQRALVMACTVPFIAAFGWLNERKAGNA